MRATVYLALSLLFACSSSENNSVADAAGTQDTNSSTDVAEADSPLPPSVDSGQYVSTGTLCGGEALFSLLLDERKKQPDTNAISVSVYRPVAKCRFDAMIGLANIKPATAAQLGDRFRLGSITKTFTAAVIFQLLEEKKLSLDDVIDKYVKGIPNGQSITLRHLLSHTSGIFNYSNDVNIGNKALTPQQIVDFAIKQSPVFSPGSRYSYSNTNYILLGMIIEQLTSESWAKQVRKRLLDPLALKATFIEGSEPSLPFVRGYVFGSGDITTLVDPSLSWSAGAIVSNGEDVTRWADALFRGNVLQSSSLKEMLTRFKLNSGSEINRGLGVEVESGTYGPTYGHSGLSSGFTVQFTHVAADGTSIFVGGNDFSFKPDPMMSAVLKHVMALK